MTDGQYSTYYPFAVLGIDLNFSYYTTRAKVTMFPHIFDSYTISIHVHVTCFSLF